MTDTWPEQSYRPKRDPWDVEKADFVPSDQAIRDALLAFREGRPVNCIQTAHIAKAASLYLKQKTAAAKIDPLAGTPDGLVG